MIHEIVPPSSRSWGGEVYSHEYCGCGRSLFTLRFSIRLFSTTGVRDWALKTENVVNITARTYHHCRGSRNHLCLACLLFDNRSPTGLNVHIPLSGSSAKSIPLDQVIWPQDLLAYPLRAVVTCKRWWFINVGHGGSFTAEVSDSERLRTPKVELGSILLCILGLLEPPWIKQIAPSILCLYQSAGYMSFVIPAWLKINIKFFLTVANFRGEWFCSHSTP